MTIHPWHDVPWGTGFRDHFLAVVEIHVDDPQFSHCQDIDALPPHTLAELERLFLDYKTLERKRVAIEKLQGRREAEAVIADAIRLYASEAPRLRAGK